MAKRGRRIDFWIDGPIEYFSWHLYERWKQENGKSIDRKTSTSNRPSRSSATANNGEKVVTPAQTASHISSEISFTPAKNIPTYPWTGMQGAAVAPMIFLLIPIVFMFTFSFVFGFILFIAYFSFFWLGSTKTNESMYCVNTFDGRRYIIGPAKRYLIIRFIYKYQSYISGETAPRFMSVTTTSRTGAAGTVRVSYTYRVTNPIAYFNNEGSRQSLEARITSSVASLMAQNMSLESAVDTVVAQSLGVALDKLGIEIGEIAFQSSELPQDSMSFLNLLGAYLTASEHFKDKSALDKVFRSKFVEAKELDVNLGIPALVDALVRSR